MSDGPIVPMDDTNRWYESGPEPILKDPDMAVLMVRLGLAMNALNAQLDAGVVVESWPSAVRLRNLLCSMVNSAAFMHEARRLCSEKAPVLRELAQRGAASPKLLESIGQLTAGKHPAAKLLGLARNQLGFHWDDDVVRASVLEYGKNDVLVWLELSGENTVHRLASDVLAHAAFPEASSSSDPEIMEKSIKEAMSHLSSAMHIIVEYFGACLSGYFRTIGAIVRTKSSPTE